MEISNRLFFISSDDGLSSESKSNSDFVVYLKERVDAQRVTYVIIKDITVPNFFYNIRSSYGEVNNNLVFSEDGVTNLVASIPEGQYLIGEFITALSAAMTAAGSHVYTVTEDTKTRKLNFAATGNFIILANNESNPMGSVIGMSKIDSTLGLNFTAPFMYDLSGIQNVYIQSRIIAQDNAVDGDFGVVSIAEEVSLAKTPFGSYATRQNNDSELSQINYNRRRDLSRIDISLVDRKGNILPIGNGNLSISLKVFY